MASYLPSSAYTLQQTAWTQGTGTNISGYYYDFKNESIKPMTPPKAAISDNLAWLDRRVNELRVAL